MSLQQVRDEFARALTEYRRIFGQDAATAGAPGWQATANSRQVYDEAGLLYASDTRGESAFFPGDRRPRFQDYGNPQHPADFLAHRETVPVLPLVMAEIDGRSGLVATQGFPCTTV